MLGHHVVIESERTVEIFHFNLEHVNTNLAVPHESTFYDTDICVYFMRSRLCFHGQKFR